MMDVKKSFCLLSASVLHLNTLDVHIEAVGKKYESYLRYVFEKLLSWWLMP